MNGVIETSTGDLLRAGCSDFENDGSFDAATETYRTDVPSDALVKHPWRGGNMSRWNGSSWVTVPQPVFIEEPQVTFKTVDVSISGTYSLDVGTFTRSVFYLKVTGDVTMTATNICSEQIVYISFKQDATGGHTITLDSTFATEGGLQPAFETSANAINTLILMGSPSQTKLCEVGFIKNVKQIP